VLECGLQELATVIYSGPLSIQSGNVSMHLLWMFVSNTDVM